ncbi:LytR/AlgR family response regulator transcription factor [Flavihumibacter petaseus]|uniref:Putative LytTR family DNA-binding protein n=1 Tax=Flavihumibacter petaseus NBRC 106054 TaxID=1220578 RepID=A0A0E9N6H7_9BACT|nr:LytTR family DNA-binding domain-containing protein [Flavihumibacter petaseus]GAO45393.1 putative LytTR family DNA-binding protein [Flavihumibacter petaseus NBRC 106054]
MKSTHIWIRGKDEIFRVPHSSIRYIVVDGKYCDVYAENEAYQVAVNMRQMIAALDDSNFIQLHRSYYINVRYISGFSRDGVIIGDRCLPVEYHLYRKVIKTTSMIKLRQIRNNA